MKPLETLRALGTGDPAPSEAKQRVYGALMASLAASVAANAGVAAAKSATLPSVPAPLIAGLTSAKAFAIGAGIWLIGGATGAALYGVLHPQEVRVVYVDRPVLSRDTVPSATPTPSATQSALVTAVSNADATPSAAAEPKPMLAAPARPTSELARERALLDLARAHAASGAPALVLAQTERHRAEFPRGKLAEEREALAIRALLSLGRADEAHRRAQVFHLAYPNSFLSSAIDSALSAP